jgi:hypothetical protein
MAYTRLAKTFIGCMVLAAAATIANAAFHSQSWHPFLALTLLAIAVITSRMKVTIPGLNGNMSVNMPFLLLSVVALSATESILIACASTAAQSLPKKGDTLKPVRILFNVSMMAFISSVAGAIFHHPGLSRLSAPLLLTLATLTFFLGQTMLVSIVVALTDSGAVWRIWQAMAQMLFPYYVASAGVTAMVHSAGNRIGWVATMALLPVMYGIHRSYRMYFAGSAQTFSQPPAMAMAAGAGASH